MARTCNWRRIQSRKRPAALTAHAKQRMGVEISLGNRDVTSDDWLGCCDEAFEPKPRFGRSV